MNALSPLPPVVPAGTMSRADQPVFRLPNGFRLRPWREPDADVLVRSCLDPEIQRWNRPAPLSRDGARAKIEHWRGRWRDEQAAIWAVVPPGGTAPVGLVGLADVDLGGGTAEFLYWLLPEGRGRGAVAGATRRISRWALDGLGLHRLRITHSVANPASCHVAARAGFALEGTMRSALLHADGWHDEHLHARVQGDPGAP
ncbi:GNAT family N-acetyltransferase [Streptomyces sp. NRRL S-87]|uniref:GNAT family N-acetyltransferase n=1 Tax=Streptomyces sp. NRRL S-87 TaxID=1463920 RepID=UPI0004C11E2F|nr:GNAT family N-acetyltransferase [Streptomyces sp. NRRL S-87]